MKSWDLESYIITSIDFRTPYLSLAVQSLTHPLSIQIIANANYSHLFAIELRIKALRRRNLRSVGGSTRYDLTATLLIGYECPCCRLSLPTTRV